MKFSTLLAVLSFSSVILSAPKHHSTSSGTTQQVGQSAPVAANNHHRKHKQHKRPRVAVIPLPATCNATEVTTHMPYLKTLDSPTATACPSFSCFLTRMADPRTCFRATHSSIPAAICTSETADNSSYVCMNSATFTNVTCGPAPTGSFTAKFINLGCDVTVSQPCKGGAAVASCSLTDPLVLDMNHNGIVEAKAGQGIDLDLGGKPIGAAVNGDKMLAMSGLVANGKIDGRSVFGDKTISPYTKLPYQALNGFEALHKVALEAQAKGKVKIIKRNSVDVILLAAQLEKIGVTLGFVSDNDDSLVEPLYGVKTINLKYRQVNDNGLVARKQIGTFEDLNGKLYPIDDVWFSI